MEDTIASHVDLDRLEKVGEGREAQIFAWEDGTVLRVPGYETYTGIKAELAAIAAAEAGGLRVPHYHGEVPINGKSGYVFQRLDGPDMLDELARRPWRMRGLSHELGRLHAKMNSIKAPPNLGSILERYRNAPAELANDNQQPFVDTIRPVLDRLNDGDSITHGDFHPGNVMLHRGEQFVIDWSAAAAGPAEADVARTLVLLDLAELPDDTPAHFTLLAAGSRALIRRWYLSAYKKTAPLSSRSLHDWYTVRLFFRLGEPIGNESERIVPLLKERLVS